MSMAACTKVLMGNYEYLVATGSLGEDIVLEEEYKVIGIPLDKIVISSCNLFNRIGILCAHALKVLDLMNIKSLPAQYILKRWTCQVWSGNIHDKNERIVIENPKLHAMLRYRYSHMLLNLAHRAAYYPECTPLMDSIIELLDQQIEDKISTYASISNDDHSAAHVDAAPPNETLSNAQLKKRGSYKKFKETKIWMGRKAQGEEKGTKHNFAAGIIIQFHIII
jgi:hypothetical protein